MPDVQPGTESVRVVINDEGQYSVWPAEKSNPRGWRDTGVSGTKADCLAHIESVWHDMRPLSLQRAMSPGNGPSV